MARAEKSWLSELKAQFAEIETARIKREESAKRVCLWLDKKIAEADSQASKNALNRDKSEVIRKTELLKLRSRAEAEELRQDLVGLTPTGALASISKRLY